MPVPVSPPTAQSDGFFLPDIHAEMHWASRHAWPCGAVVGAFTVQPGGLWLIEEGAVEVDLEGRRWRVPAGHALLLPASVERERIATPEGAVWWSAGVLPLLFGRVDVWSLLGPPLLWRPDTAVFGQLRACIETALPHWVPAPGVQLRHAGLPPPHVLRDRHTARLITGGLAAAIFGLCWQHRPAEGRPLGGGMLATTDMPTWLLEILLRVERHPEMNVTEMAAASGFSPAHFRRSFRKWVGQSPQDYQTARRLERARHLLRTTDRTVADVASELGFESVSYFTRLFSRRFGDAPARWRHAVAALNALPPPV